MLITIAVVALLVCVFVAYLTYKSHMRTVAKIIVFPCIIALSLLMGKHYVDSLGLPIEGKPSGEFTYVHHKSSNKFTHLWVTQDKQDKLYVFPYNRENEKEMNEAKKKGGKGAPITGRFEKERKGDLSAKDTFKFRVEPIAGPEKVSK